MQWCSLVKFISSFLLAKKSVSFPGQLEARFPKTYEWRCRFYSPLGFSYPSQCSKLLERKRRCPGPADSTCHYNNGESHLSLVSLGNSSSQRLFCSLCSGEECTSDKNLYPMTKMKSQVKSLLFSCDKVKQRKEIWKVLLSQIDKCK